MKTTQKETNPFPFSDSNKRYHTYEYYLRNTFGGKCAKIPLDGGFTCPNIDGRCGVGGCIYCSPRGSGDTAADSALSVAEQFCAVSGELREKWRTERYIAYFQAHTNTYAPLDRLRELYEAALARPDVVGLNIATRADCIADDVLAYLAELSGRTVLTLELGLQTVHDRTARRINRGHDYRTFLQTYQKIRQAAPGIRLGVHLIFGLIGENDEMMVETVQRVGELAPDEVKFHLLYVLEHTKMADLWRTGAYIPLGRDHYTDLVVRGLELLPKTTVIGRLTGDGMKNDLLTPLWSRNKRFILNEIDKKIYGKNTWQGKALE